MLNITEVALAPRRISHHMIYLKVFRSLKKTTDLKNIMLLLKLAIQIKILHNYILI